MAIEITVVKQKISIFFKENFMFIPIVKIVTNNYTTKNKISNTFINIHYLVYGKIQNNKIKVSIKLLYA